MNKRVIIVIGCVLVLILPILGVTGTFTRAADAAPLTGTEWCANKDSLAVIGGSTNTGYRTTGYVQPPNKGYYPTAYGWWRGLTSQLTASYGVNDDGQPFSGWNYAHNGASAHNYLPGAGGVYAGDVTELGVHNPDLIIVSVGTNEFLGQLDPAQFQANLNQLVSNIRDAGITDILLVIQHEVGLVGVEHPYNEYATAIYNVAVNRSAALIDMRQRVPKSGASGNPGGLYTSVETAPQIHLSDAGQMVYRASYWTLLYAGC